MPRLQLQLNESGSGQIEILRSDPANADLEMRRFIQLAYRGQIRGGFFIEQIEREEKEGEQWVRISGRGMLSILDDAVVWAEDLNKREFTSMSVGEILKTLVDEAQARGCFSNLDLSFDETNDTTGTAWGEWLTMSLSIGTSLLEVVHQFAQYGYDFNVVPWQVVRDLFVGLSADWSGLWLEC